MCIPSLMVILRIAVENADEVVHLVVAARVPYQTATFFDDELHPAVVVFCELDGLGVGS